MEEERYNDLVKECRDFVERIASKYGELIERDSPCMDIKRIESRDVISFNDTNFYIAVAPRHKVEIGFIILG